MELNKYQKRTLEYLRREKPRYFGFLGDPGTGKTLACLEYLNIIPTKKVLWITKKVLIENTIAEFKKWEFEKNYLIIGIDQINKGGERNKAKLKAFDYIQVENPNDLAVVFDESTMIKNNSTISYNIVKKLSANAGFRFILNGTLLTRSGDDLWAQIDFLSPKILNMSFTEFKQKTDIEVEITKWNGDVVRYFNGKKANMDKVYSVIEKYVSKGGLELSVIKSFARITYESDADLDFIKATEISDKGDKSTVYGLEALKIIASRDAEKNGTETIQMLQRGQREMSLEEARLHKLEQFKDKKVLVFCKYVKTKEEIEKRMSNALVLTYDKGSVGLNLQEYKTTIFYDLTFNYYQKEQAIYRTYRTGQDENVEFYEIVANNWLDKMLEENIEKKGDLKNLLVKKDGQDYNQGD